MKTFGTLKIDFLYDDESEILAVEPSLGFTNDLGEEKSMDIARRVYLSLALELRNLNVMTRYKECDNEKINGLHKELLEIIDGEL